MAVGADQKGDRQEGFDDGRRRPCPRAVLRSRREGGLCLAASNDACRQIVSFYASLGLAEPRPPLGLAQVRRSSRYVLRTGRGGEGRAKAEGIREMGRRLQGSLTVAGRRREE